MCISPKQLAYISCKLASNGPCVQECVCECSAHPLTAPELLSETKTETDTEKWKKNKCSFQFLCFINKLSS